MSAPPLPVPFGQSPGQMVLSPDGQQIYQAAEDTLNVFDVEGISSGSGGAPASPAARSAAPQKAKAPKILSLNRDRKGHYRVKVRVFEAGTIRARFSGKLKPQAKVRTLGKVTTKRVAKPATYLLKVTPSDAARELMVKATLRVSIAPPGYTPAEASRVVKLR